jgi:hypothetical protein
MSSVVRNSYTWRAGIIKSNLAPTTKHVLLTLSCHFNDAGEACYPTTRLQAQETGLSEKCVITHLAIARELGWLKVSKHGFAGQRWSHNQYMPCFPEGTEPPSVPSKKGTEPNDQKALNDVQCNYSVELLSLNTTTTTTAPKALTSGSGGVFENLIIEPVIGQYLPQLLDVLLRAGVAETDAQDLLDELVGTIEAGKRGERQKVANPVLWLQGVVAGKFKRARCFEVRARRQSVKASVQLACKRDDLDIDPVASAKGAEYFSIARVRARRQAQQKEKRT